MSEPPSNPLSVARLRRRLYIMPNHDEASSDAEEVFKNALLSCGGVTILAPRRGLVRLRPACNVSLSRIANVEFSP